MTVKPNWCQQLLPWLSSHRAFRAGSDLLIPSSGLHLCCCAIEAEALSHQQMGTGPTRRGRHLNGTLEVKSSILYLFTFLKFCFMSVDALLGVHNLLASTLHVMLTFDLLPLPSSVDSHCHGNPKAPVGGESGLLEGLGQADLGEEAQRDGNPCF